MYKFEKGTAAVIALVLLAGCAGNSGGNEMQTSGSSEREVSTEVGTEVSTETTTELSTEFETTAKITTSVTTTALFVTEAPVITTTAATTTTTTAPTVQNTDGVTANGHSITVSDGITYVDGVLIANKTYALPETYAPGGLTSETYSAFIDMQSAASAEGLYLFVKSGYRSFYDQRYIYNGYVARDGAAAADRYSARAGHSEHQSGMAIDVNSTMDSFADTAEGIWLKNNCYKYGFIIRYPEGKEHITGYMYEPWHVRYVGVELAAAVTESGLCLEEYFGINSVYS